MPRRRINVAKLYVLKAQLNALAIARERRLATREFMFDAFQRPQWESAVQRVWLRLQQRRPSTPAQLAAVRRMVRLRQLERVVA